MRETNNISKEVLEKGKKIIKAQLKNEGRHQQKPLFFVQSVERYDAVNDDLYTEAHIVKDINFVRSGYCGLNATALKVLEVIVAHIDKDGFSYVSQDKIADILGITRQSVNGALHNYLLEGTNKKTGKPKEVYYGGKLLLKAVKLPAPNGHLFTLYHPVNAFVDHTPYVYDDADLISDDDDYVDDTPVISLEDLDTIELDELDNDAVDENKEGEPETVGESEAFIMEKKEDIVTNTKPLEKEAEIVTVTKNTTTKTDKDIDMFAFKALADETVEVAEVKKEKASTFKRGKATEAGKAQAGANKYKDFNDDTDKFLAL